MASSIAEKTPRERGLFFISEATRWRLLVCGVLMVCLLPFLPGLSGPFQLDDTVNLESVHVGDASFGAIYQATFNNTSGLLRRPLSNLTLIANQLISGYDPFGYKVVNLLLHLACGFLVYLLARRLLPLLGNIETRSQRWVALGAAALWAVHPLQVSTVLYVVQRMTQLATLVMLLAIILAVQRLATPGALARPRQGLFFAVAVGMVSFLAVLAKETGVLVPVLLLAIWLSLPDRSRSSTTDTDGKRTFWGWAVGLPVTIAVLALIHFWSWIQGAYTGRQFTLGERLATEPMVIGGYLKSFFLPDLRDMGLFLDAVPLHSPSDALAWAGFVAVGLALGAAWWARRRIPLVSLAVFWFAGAHLMESTFLHLELAFEHRNYLALFGPCLLVAYGVFRLGTTVRPRVAVLVGAFVLLTMGGLTFVRASAWSSQEEFIASELRHHPASIRAQTEAAIYESLSGRNDLAIQRLATLEAKQPALFFPKAMDMDVACGSATHSVDWLALQDVIRGNPADNNITAFHKTIALKIQRSQCVSGFAEDFESHLGALIRIYRELRMPQYEQFFLMVKADLQDDIGETRQLLQAAIAADPSRNSALYRLAYVELNAGNVGAAKKAIDRLDANTPWWHPDHNRIVELRGFLADLRRTQALAPPPG